MTNQIYKGHLVRKRYGQNFLNNRFIIDSIVSAINPQKDQAIVEIGPGLAALTESVCRSLDKLTVIELDHNLVTRLKMHPLIGSKLIIYQQNAMNMDFGELAKKMGQPLRLFGNLPYNISTSLLFHLFRYTNAIIDMHFMLQKEVVDRIIAKPNTKEYGRLSVMTQYFCNIIQIFEVPPSVFTPSPKVNSAMIRLVPHRNILNQRKNLNILKYITTKAFSQRRKMIRNSLGDLFNIKVLEKLNINSEMRAENISVEQYCKLINYVSYDVLSN